MGYDPPPCPHIPEYIGGHTHAFPYIFYKNYDGLIVGIGWQRSCRVDLSSIIFEHQSHLSFMFIKNIMAE